MTTSLGIELSTLLAEPLPRCDQSFLDTVESAVGKILSAETKQKKESVKRLISFLDLTTLSGDDTPQRVWDLVDRAVQPVEGASCAAICVYPARLFDVVSRLSFHAKQQLKTETRRPAIASVAGGFPSGQYKLESRSLEVELAVKDGADEIDIVISRAQALQGLWQELHDDVSHLKRACGSAVLKTILAVGELQTKENVYRASFTAMLAGSDFIKTSTGKEAVNANIPDSFLMCSAIKRFYQLTGKKIGFKAAGGIKTVAEALSYFCLVESVLGSDWLTPSLFRIGASSLLDDIIKVLQE